MRNHILVRNGQSYMMAEMPVPAVFTPGNYLLKKDAFGNYYMDRIDDFVFPNKVYGNMEGLADRYMKTFRDRTGSTGIFLCGIKGSGKTLTAQMLCARSELPVVIVNKPYSDNGFHQFISELPGELIVFFDEFEKVYSDKSEQDSLLTLFDGNFKRKRLFLMTSNTEDINYFFRNRPGRIYYKKVFRGLDPSAVDEYIADKLTDETKADGIKRVINTLENASMDILACLVDEVNRFGEDAATAASFMNLEIETNSMYKGRYKVVGEDGELYAKGPCSFRHPYSRAHQSMDARLASVNGKFITERAITEVQRNGTSEERDALYFNDVNFKIDAGAWSTVSDGEFAAKITVENEGEDGDVEPMTFTVSVSVSKEKSWSYTF